MPTTTITGPAVIRIPAGVQLYLETPDVVGGTPVPTPTPPPVSTPPVMPATTGVELVFRVVKDLINREGGYRYASQNRSAVIAKHIVDRLGGYGSYLEPRIRSDIFMGDAQRMQWWLDPKSYNNANSSTNYTQAEWDLILQTQQKAMALPRGF